jgi:phage-related protein
MYEVLFYRDQKDRCQVLDFLNKLQIKERAKIEKWIQKLEHEGSNLPRPFADTVKGKIRELRIGFGSNSYRFLYFFCGKNIVITNGFIKKTNKIPLREIRYSEKRMHDFLKRNK